jgi:hypothetical protein
MIALIAAIGFGVAAGALVGAIVTGDPLYTITASLAFTVAVMVAVFGGIGSVTRGMRRAASAEATQTGELALARVERIARTGFSVNDQPQTPGGAARPPARPRRPARSRSTITSTGGIAPPTTAPTSSSPTTPPGRSSMRATSTSPASPATSKRPASVPASLIPTP